MNFQKKPSQQVLDVLEKKGISHLREYLEYYAFPQTFGSTSGPHGGIGGMSMSVFTVEAWVHTGDYVGESFTIYECAGLIKFVKGEYKAHW